MASNPAKTLLYVENGTVPCPRTRSLTNTRRYSSLDDLAHCPIDRPLGAGPQDGMVLVNHWLQKNVSDILIPDKCMAIVTNSEKYINGHVQSCRRTLGKTPNFMLVSSPPISH